MAVPVARNNTKLTRDNTNRRGNTNPSRATQTVRDNTKPFATTPNRAATVMERNERRRREVCRGPNDPPNHEVA